ncbi:hypothetical protein BH09ACT13_BH09ACT13_03520 [soil metagenome]
MRSARWGFGVLLVVLASALGVGQWTGPNRGSAAPGADTVTLVFSQYRNVNGVLVLVFSGTVSSGAAGEEVEVVGQDCGGQGFRLIGGTQTRAGGGWQVQNPEQMPPWRWAPADSGMTFRARWKGQLSDPVVWRLPAVIGASKVPGRRAWKVFVSPSRGTLDGRIVELQRQVGRRRVRYRRARLVHKASYDRGPFNHEAVFAVAARGLKLRAFLPAKSAAPCYLAGATEPWRT